LSGPISAKKRDSAGLSEDLSQVATAPGLLRRVAAICYDWMLLSGTMFVTSLPLIWLIGGVPKHWASQTGFRLFLAGIIFVFFGWFWTHGGQTLGMRAWRLRLVSDAGGEVTWRMASVRFLAAFVSLLCLGLGFLWVMHDRERRAWHDRWSGTRLQLLPKARSR